MKGSVLVQEIHGYRLIGDFTTTDAGFCKWAFAKRNRHEFFIKEFISPRYPSESHGLDETVVAVKRKQCEEFFQTKKVFYEQLKRCRTGNIMWICDFFRDGSKYYAVTDKVYGKIISADEICYLSNEKKLIIIRALLHSFSVLHAHHIVHADVRPENILIKETVSGYYTPKIIDFDASYFEEEPPEEIFGDMVYLAPESRLQMMEVEVPLTTKVDIFSLGILLHLYWTGQLPGTGTGYDYAFEVVLDDKELILSNNLPGGLKTIIQRMLQKQAEYRPSAEEILCRIDALCKDVIPEKSDDTRRGAYPKERSGRSVLRVPSDLG